MATARKKKAMTTATAPPDSYKELHKALPKMTEKELLAAMQRELDKGNKARGDMLMRLIGRFNRLRGARVMNGVMGLLGYKGKRDVRPFVADKR